jgi:hypothetical protein
VPTTLRLSLSARSKYKDEKDNFETSLMIFNLRQSVAEI